MMNGSLHVVVREDRQEPLADWEIHEPNGCVNGKIIEESSTKLGNGHQAIAMFEYWIRENPWLNHWFLAADSRRLL